MKMLLGFQRVGDISKLLWVAGSVCLLHIKEPHMVEVGVY